MAFGEQAHGGERFPFRLGVRLGSGVRVRLAEASGHGIPAKRI